MYRLDPADFDSAPNLRWDAMLVTTDVAFGLLSDIDMLLFAKKLFEVFSTAWERWDIFELSKYIYRNLIEMKNSFLALFLFLPQSMVRKLPRDGYKWCEIKNIVELMGKYRSSTDFGYFVEIDLEYPREIHDDHSDFPLAPEKLVIKDDCLSAYNENLVFNRSVVPKSIET